MKTLSHYSKEHGYIALMATIIIAAVLLVMSVEGSIAGWRARFNVLGTEAKEQASALAQGCADQALSAIMTDPSYTGDATTTTDVGTCHVFPIEFNFPIEGVVSIRTQAVVRGSYANLEMQLDMSEIHIDSIPEAPTKGTIVVITNVVNDGEGALHASDFTMHTSGGNPTLTSFAGSESGVIVRVDPGAYSITEDSASGYATTFSTNCTGSIGTGDIAFCTVTNDDITTTLTILVNVVNDNGGTREYDEFSVFIDGNPVASDDLGTPLPVTPGAHTASASSVTGYAVSSWGYQCDSDGDVHVAEGQSKTCIINFNDNPPPTPSCAETVVMLDRSYSMFGYPDYPSGYTQWIPDEKTAAKSLIDLYSSVTPNPKMSIGRFGDVATGRSAEIIHQLSTSYSAMKTAVDNGLPSNPISYTNLEAAISKARAELNSVRHTAGKEKVIIMVSDGEPNEPSGTSSFDTGFLSPTVGVQDSLTSLWSDPANAYSDGGGDASGLVTNSTNRERYYSFNVRGGAGLPSGATVNGIEIKADAWATAPASSAPGSAQGTPSQGTTPNSWSNTTRADTSNDSYVTDSTNGHQQGFNNFGFNIPANATITGVQVSTEAKVTGSPTTVLTDGFGTGNPTDVPNWNENGNDTVVLTAGSGNDSASPNGGSFARIDDNGGWICRTVNTSGISNLSLAYNWRGDSDAENYNPSGSDNGPDIGYVEYNTSGSADCNGSNGWTLVESHDLSIDNSWSTFSEALPSVLDNDNSWTIRFRNPSVNGNGNPEYFRVDGVQLTGVSGSGSGSLNVALSSNGGGVYTAVKSIPLTGTETVTAPTGNSATDMWGRAWTPSDFNSNNFVVRLDNQSPSGNTVSLDTLTVTINYTTPVIAGTACQLGIDLSWNGGTNWTNEKTQNLTNNETTYTLGSISNDWRSGSWASGDFSNANFRARVRAIDSGNGCDNNALVHLDWLRMNVRYTQNVDPQQAALDAADSAKLDGINLFTIHFGADPSGYAGKELLANLASGGTAVSGHQNGSYADPSSVTSGSTGYVSPTSQASVSGAGDGNGFEITPAEAFGDGGDYARNMDGPGDRHIFGGYNLVIPPGATIVGIQTRLDWWLSTTQRNNSMNVELSWNGGTSWTSAKTESNESTSNANTRTLGGSSDTWGHTWSASDLSPSNFKVRVTSNCSGGSSWESSCNNRDFYLDWIPVTVYYTVNNENGDDDNFFVSPTSADMDDIFDYIAGEVCPAIGFAEASEPPTTGSVTVITKVVNNNSGVKTPEDVSVSVTPSSATPNSFDGSTAGTVVVLQPGNYTVTGDVPDGYVEVAGAGCSSSGGSGDIIAGEARVCVITYDDIPPPPPPPDLTIHLGSWKEVPIAE